MLIFFLVIFCLACSNDRIVSSIDYPEPGGYVNDYTDTISEEWIIKTEELVQSVERKTSCEIAVAVIDSLGGSTIEEYAAGLFNEWGIGKAEQDNGILLLVALDDRELRIEVGYGLEGVITDLQAKEIIEDVIVPRFQNNSYDSGIYNGVIAISNEIYRDQGMQQASLTDSVSPAPKRSFIESGAFFAIIILISVLSPWVLGGTIFGGFRLRRYLRDHRCPKCKRIGLIIKYKTIIKPTYISPGRREVEKHCKYCGYHEKKTTTIPILAMHSSSSSDSSSSGGFTSSGSSSSSSGSSSSGGFGGGSSGGGGASGSW